MKRCPYCAEEIQEAAVKCRFCGSNVQIPPGSPQASAGGAVAAGGPPLGGGAASAGVPTAASAGAASVTIFAGGPSWKSQFWGHTGAVLVAIIGVVSIFMLPSMISSLSYKTSMIVGLVLVAAGAAWFGYLWLMRTTIRYNVNTRTIDVETGLFSKTIETMQLWKVRDVEFHQSLFDRLLNVAHIKVFTHDVTTPQLMMWGLPESRGIFDGLKNAIELARQSRNVIGVVE